MNHFCFVFLHYTDANMCLSGEELNNDGLGQNKHIIKGIILLGLVLEYRVSRATGNLHFFYFDNPFQSNLSPQHPQSNLLRCLSPLIELFMNPRPFPIELLHLIFNQPESDKPILSNPAVSDLWPAAITHATWWKMVMWPTKDCWIVHLITQTDKKIFLYIIKQSLLTASPSAFTLLSN